MMMLLKTKSIFIATKELVFICPKKYKQPAPSNVLLNGVCVQLSDKVKRLLCASLKDDIDIQRQVKSCTFQQTNPDAPLLQ